MSSNRIISNEATVNGVRIHYRIAGSGNPLILLHGSPLTSRSWLRLMPALAKTYTVVAPDFRGYGQSDKPETGYEVQTMVEDLRQLLDQLGIKSASVVGHDLGGIVAYVYAAQHRDQVSKLGIIEAPIVGAPSPTMERVRAGYWHIGFYAHPRLPELLIAGRERDYLAEFIRTYQHNREAFDKEDLNEYAHHIASPGGLRGMLGVYRAIAAEVPDLIQLTQTKLTVPVWAVGGDHSMGMGPFEQFQSLAETVTGGVIENCGHWVIEEQPGQVLEDLGEFLRQ
jgi:pimeloyl-ACP methyl ester carboxylesterase